MNATAKQHATRFSRRDRLAGTRAAMRLITLALALALAGCSGDGSGTLRVTGQIEGTSIEAGSRIGGRVVEVLAAEGDRVNLGDVIVRLDDSEQRAMVEAASARLAQAEAALERLVNGARPEELRQAEAAAAEAAAAYDMALAGARSEEIATARAQSEAARAALDRARIDFERASKLRNENAISQQAYDHARTAFEAADAQFKASREQLDLLVHGTREEQVRMALARRDRAAAAYDLLRNGARREDLDAACAARDAARADLDRAETALREMTVTAPRAGLIEALDVHPGDLVQPGPIVRISDPEALELPLYVSARALGHLRIGQNVSFTTDSHGDAKFSGTLRFIAAEGEFTPRNLQTEEERVQQVFRIKVVFDSAGGRLRPGMTAVADLGLSRDSVARASAP